MVPKKWENSAERKREYRKRRKNEGNPVPRGSDVRKSEPHGYDKPREFIAWDGEGIDLPSYTDDENRVWTPHNFTLLAASTGETISAEKLDTRRCLMLMLSVAKKYPNAKHVMFAGNYDVTHMLYDLPRETIQDIEKPEGIYWQGFWIRYIPRKQLTVKKGKDSITVWDTFGFFQAKFSDVIEKWLGSDYPDLPLIRQGKELRSQFNVTDDDFILKYNQAELTALVKIMELLDISLKSLDLNLRRWDGAGAIAGRMMEKHSFKKHIGTHPVEIEEAARFAYFGGRFEQGMYGYEETTINFYDINSAYPTTITQLPSLASGRWVHDSAGNLPNFGIYRVRWNCPTSRFGPFGIRHRGHVWFPQRGTNWVWGYELNAYLDWAERTSAPALCSVTDGYYFLPDDPDYHPFTWVGEYYDLRQRISNGETNLPPGCEKVIKLGINSIYGKTAQSVGYNPERNRLPPYYSLLYSGAITAATRAKVWAAAMQSPDDIVMIATDGVFSKSELTVPLSSTKELGKWEYSHADTILSLQSGIYTSRKNGQWMIQSRGIDKKAGNDTGLQSFIAHFNGTIVTGYEHHDETAQFTSTRMINLRVAKQETVYDQRGYWVKNNRDVKISPDADRYGKRNSQHRENYPVDSLVSTVPNRMVQYAIDQGELESTPYERPWDFGRDDDAAFLEGELEMWDVNW